MKEVFWLATDLDGTFIPTSENKSEHVDALKVIGDFAQTHEDREIVFVTGRHLDSVIKVMDEERLPFPSSIICDVGTSIYDWNGQTWKQNTAYKAELDSILGDVDVCKLQKRFRQHTEIQLQEADKQGEHKLSYYCEGNKLADISNSIERQIARETLPYSIVASVDPFTNQGLIDLLPKGVNKLFAIRWFKENAGLKASQKLIFAGDSGNDLAVFLSGIPSIVVHNTPIEVKLQVKDYFEVEKKEISSVVFFSDGSSTSGVLQGLRFFEWFK